MIFISLVPIIMVCRCAVMFCFDEPEDIVADRDQHIKNIDIENFESGIANKN